MGQHVLAVNVTQSLQNMLDTVMHSIPKIVLFLVILVIGWIVARVIMQAVVMVLRKVHFDRFAQRGIVGDALGRSNYDATMLIGKIVYYLLLLVTLQLAFGVFGNNPISTMLNAVVGWLPKAIVALVLVVIGSAIAKVVKDLINGAIGGMSYGPFVATLASVVIIALFAIAALEQIGVANSVLQPLLVTALATVGLILAIGIGGGLVRPMQSRWERMLTVVEDETTRQAAAYQQGRTDAMNAPKPSATQGTQGLQGAQATQGTRGPEGTSGPQGMQGPQGPSMPGGTPPQQ